jgi:hypothetical protein
MVCVSVTTGGWRGTVTAKKVQIGNNNKQLRFYNVIQLIAFY